MIGAENKKGFMYRLAEFIVDRRNIIFAIVIVGIIFSVFSMGWVNVENDLTAFLPEDSGSKKGVEIMNEEFVTYGMAQVMIANVTLEEAEEIAEILKQEMENAADFSVTLTADANIGDNWLDAK